ncbi:hypothetical protein I7I50_10233 [Histoplasma capsulatum G186AR]|uniref:Uncharacterized protein n=1 Tax=Ajellomyces capsulatus TaxID=5037 RepID=A0A8H7Z964_AJECA|nr:hypothetical protein I7I52_01472 [Histoplasma capsulatum]QSS69060.1 hypothetical protein I7I50_10233 [Histoplasma capsulatum G186AR]
MLQISAIAGPSVLKMSRSKRFFTRSISISCFLRSSLYFAISDSLNSLSKPWASVSSASVSDSCTRYSFPSSSSLLPSSLNFSLGVYTMPFTGLVCSAGITDLPGGRNSRSISGRRCERMITHK